MLAEIISIINADADSASNGRPCAHSGDIDIAGMHLAPNAPVTDIPALISAGLAEVTIGALMAFGVFAAFAAFSFAGNALDLQIGFSLANIFDPITRSQSPLLAAIFGMIAVALFFTMDAHHTLLREFRRIDPSRTRVVLIEGSPRVLGAFVPQLSERARLQLVRLSVEVRTGCSVTGIDAYGVAFESRIGDAPAVPERLQCRTVVWAAGVAGVPIGRRVAEQAGAVVDRAGRVVVEADLSLVGHPEIFVVGDLASATSHAKGGSTKPVPGVSPAAKQMGRAAAANLLRSLRGEARLPFHYIDYGNLATVGRKAAVVDLAVPLIGAVRFWGIGAWLFWLFAHIYFLIGFRNRMIVMLDWAWAYFTYERSARVVAEPVRVPQGRKRL